MKDYETFKPLVVKKARGVHLELDDGSQVIDAISSWWCKSFGHNHPKLKQALFDQAEQFEHVILANTTNETIVKLAENLASLTPTLDKASFASDGSCAIEMAMKMSLHARRHLGQHKKQRFMALEQGYHGETSLTLAVSDLGLYRDAYEAILPAVNLIQSLPYVSSRHNPLWNDCSNYWPNIESQLNENADTLTAIVFEPIIQGACGMKVISQDFYARLRKWADNNDVHLIADEILTGMGRTGLPLACMHANITPDFLCLSKGLTAGWIPFSVMLTSTKMYELFYDDYETGKAFMHSHTHTGNALGASIANAVFELVEEENLYEKVQELEVLLFEHMEFVAKKTGKLGNLRGIGGMIAADLKVDDSKRVGYQVYQEAAKRGALLRPLGNTLYWFPPLTIQASELETLADITLESIKACV